MLVRYRYRLDPTAAQRAALARTFGCARVVYNDVLRLRQDAYATGERLSDTEVQRRAITLAKQTPERAWLAEVASVALVQACQDARRAYRNRFDSLSGKRRRRVGHPRFRTKHGRQSIRLTHKLALRLVRENQAVAVEDLAVAGLARTRLGKSVHDAGWATFTRLLHQKAAQHGRRVVKVGRWAPTSQTCSACGHRDGPKPLGVRAWTCQVCGTQHDRDINAARNILSILVAAGPAETQNACGAGVRPSAMAAVGGEAGTHRGAS
jgi:IS605 OrfB family transposase